ncbi:DUF1259 domain-containing protein [Aquibacillus sediminis]|uniref:DUF1259 domain-containing protein n=1 Tax=Aquibacillus sediminis TaxID=2574734 RepID=UPI0011093073|nr:DUF1259 domain-containing protein [Aquibacillus sediminis]
MQDFYSLCYRYGVIFGREPHVENGVCTVEWDRDLSVMIQGRPSHGELHAEVMFESLDEVGFALNLGESVMLEEEVPLFTNMLARNGVQISAIHNHWMYTEPTILYVHFQSVEPPLAFARKVADAFAVLR